VQVLAFASNLQTLQQMGFETTLAAGALAFSKNEANAATELCLCLR
jgi:hypothetical protein